MTLITFIATWACFSGPATATPFEPDEHPTIPIIRQTTRPAEILPGTDKLVVQSQRAILDYVFARRGEGLTVFTDGYAGRPPMNRATVLAISREFDARAYPTATARLTERQRLMLLTNGAVHVAQALGFVRDVQPVADRLPKLRAVATTAFGRFKNRLGIESAGAEDTAEAYSRDLIDRIRTATSGPVVVVLGSDRSLRFDVDTRLVRVDLPHARIFADFELARVRTPAKTKTAACAYRLHTVVDQADSFDRSVASAIKRY